MRLGLLDAEHAKGQPLTPLTLAIHQSCRDSPRITWLSDMGRKGRAMLLDLYLRWHGEKSAQGEVMLALVDYECELAQENDGLIAWQAPSW